MKLQTFGAGLVAAALALAAATAASAAEPPRCPFPLEAWTEIDLYFGRNIPTTGGEVSEGQFREFLAEVVTPRFPDGLTVLDADGQFRDGGRIVREKTKLLVLLVPDRDASEASVRQVVKRYKERFDQFSVLRTEQDVCLSFD